jgi:hypothetical protein
LLITDWEDTRRILETAQIFWICTVRANAKPHVTPLVAVWLDGAFHHRQDITALVFSVMPTKFFAFAKGVFGQTRHQF